MLTATEFCCEQVDCMTSSSYLLYSSCIEKALSLSSVKNNYTPRVFGVHPKASLVCYEST